MDIDSSAPLVLSHLSELVLAYIEPSYVLSLMPRFSLPALTSLALDLEDDDYSEFLSYLASPRSLPLVTTLSVPFIILSFSLSVSLFVVPPFFPSRSPYPYRLAFPPRPHNPYPRLSLLCCRHASLRSHIHAAPVALPYLRPSRPSIPAHPASSPVSHLPPAPRSQSVSPPSYAPACVTPFASALHLLYS